MAKKARTISVNLEAGTAKFFYELDQASGKIKQFKSHSVSEAKAVGAGMKVIEGQLFNNKKAAESFLETLVGGTGIMQKAFPLLSAIAFGSVVVELSKKMYDFYKDVQEGPEKVARAFRALHDPLRLTNDELALANSRLEQDIAKLEGQPRNMLKVALDEARVAADRLADSLDKDLERIEKVLDEQRIGTLYGLLTNQASTKDIGEDFKTFRKGIDRATEEGNLEIRSAANVESSSAARERMDARLRELYSDYIASIDRELAEIEAQKAEHKRLQPMNPLLRTPGIDYTVRVETLSDLRRQMQLEQSGIGLRDRNVDLTQRKDQLTAAKEDRQGDPFGNRIEQLLARLEAARVTASAIGRSEEFQTWATGYSEAQAIIVEVNNALEKNGQKLTELQKLRLVDLTQTIAGVAAESEWQSKLNASTLSIEQRIAAQRELAAAIGKGFEATRAASISSRVAQDLGPRAFDPAWLSAHAGDVEGLRVRYGQEFDAQHAAQTTQAVETLNRQIELERLLATVQDQGAEAVRRAALAYRIREMVMQGATREQIQAEMDLYVAQRQNRSSANLTEIKERAVAVRRLADAIMGGAEAERLSALEAKYSQMAREGSPPEVIEAQRNADAAERQQQIAKEAIQAGMAYRDQLTTLDQQIVALDRLRELHGDTFEIQVSMRDLENRRLDVLTQQTLRLGNARAGVQAFFLQMEKDAQTTAQTVYNALSQGFEQGSRELANLATGQNTNFGGMLQSIGGEMVQQQSDKAMRMGLSLAGKLFGLDLSTEQIDGQTEASALWVRLAGSGIPGLPGKGGGDLKLGDLFGGGHKGKGIFSILGFGGFRANGGPVDPGRVYMVGERGPEPFIPSTAGTVLPASTLGGTTIHNNYHIDARGADLGAENRVRRALEMTHAAAVRDGVRAMHERMQRTPR